MMLPVNVLSQASTTATSDAAAPADTHPLVPMRPTHRISGLLSQQRHASSWYSKGAPRAGGNTGRRLSLVMACPSSALGTSLYAVSPLYSSYSRMPKLYTEIAGAGRDSEALGNQFLVASHRATYRVSYSLSTVHSSWHAR